MLTNPNFQDPGRSARGEDGGVQELRRRVAEPSGLRAADPRREHGHRDLSQVHDLRQGPLLQRRQRREVNTQLTLPRFPLTQLFRSFHF